MSTTTIVIPCYNEAERLNVPAFVAYVEAVSGINLLFVNDGSSDKTQDVLDKLVESNSDRMSSLLLEQNGGKAEAVRRGFIKAFDSEPDYVGFWDADLATPLEDIIIFRDILTEREQLVTVFGSRVNLLGRSVERKLMRHYIGRVFATAAATILGIGIYDTQCGAKLFRVNQQTKAVFQTPFISHWIFDVELIARLIDQYQSDEGPKVKDIIFEHPLMEWRDVAGSKLRMKDFITVGLDLMKIFFR